MLLALGTAKGLCSVKYMPNREEEARLVKLQRAAGNPRAFCWYLLCRVGKRYCMKPYQWCYS